MFSIWKKENYIGRVCQSDKRKLSYHYHHLLQVKNLKKANKQSAISRQGEEEEEKQKQSWHYIKNPFLYQSIIYRSWWVI